MECGIISEVYVCFEKRGNGFIMLLGSGTKEDCIELCKEYGGEVMLGADFCDKYIK